MGKNKQEKEIPWSDKITNIQAKVLEGLARYKFLTLSQMLDLEVGTVHYQYLWKQVASLRDRKKALVSRTNFNQEDRIGRVEDMYFLTPAGKEALILDLHRLEDEIKMPIGKATAYRDYFHRKSTIDFQIRLDLWAGPCKVHVPFFDTYFDKSGNNRSGKNLRTKTRIDLGPEDYFIPDGVFKLVYSGKENLYLFEMHNGRETRRLLKQLHQHARALVETHTHRTFQFNPKRAYHTIFLFEHDSIKDAFVKRAIATGDVFKHIQQFFLCKSLEQLQDLDFNSGWVTLFGEQASLWQKKEG